MKYRTAVATLASASQLLTGRVHDVTCYGTGPASPAAIRRIAEQEGALYAALLQGMRERTVDAGG